ncbi:alpha-ketoglutarate dehydrogenase component 4 [Megachile rotundata]|uniref:alpha-ketoglutarate dehydrogenase component 4 n=1 Tax=Megachile rotundata TaxID=143995 RepID=UPI000258F78A|nr:PREDICTED: 28S ribosomal protein S36, mitochondrial [Megachile rotundata]XP_012151686.1 PREDICTED: 28S ribosomal protein S36, mitochondrial [Megachile rotundata]
MMASKGWKVVKPHVPLIKFRKGGISRAIPEGTNVQSTQAGPTSQRSVGATGPNVTVLPIIDDIHLPPRFQRRPIDEKEIAYINRGGPE